MAVQTNVLLSTEFPLSDDCDMVAAIGLLQQRNFTPHVQIRLKSSGWSFNASFDEWRGIMERQSKTLGFLSGRIKFEPGTAEEIGKIKLTYFTDIRSRRYIVLSSDASFIYNKYHAVPKRQCVCPPPLWTRLMESETMIDKVLTTHVHHASTVQNVLVKYSDFYTHLARESQCLNIRALVENTINNFKLDCDTATCDNYAELFISAFKQLGVECIVNNVLLKLHCCIYFLN